MQWFIFLFTIFFSGNIIQNFFFRLPPFLQMPAAFTVGSLLSVSFIYSITSFVSQDLRSSLIGYFILVILLYIIYVSFLKKYVSFPKLTKLEFLLTIFFFICSMYLFTKTFSYNEAEGQFLIASNVYRDFSVHIPFIRSFSIGDNFPAQVPFLAGEKLRYHFMFDFYAAILEFLGLRIDIALNLISAFAFSSLLIAIYTIAKVIFHNTKIATLSVILFLFNSSLSFVNFLKETPLNFMFFSAFWHNVFYRGGGPLGTETVAVYWNLNTFMNQRHLAFGILFVLFFMFVLLTMKKENRLRQIIVLGLLLGIFPLWHTFMFIAIYILLGSFFVFYPRLRVAIFIIGFIGAIFAFPQMLFLKSPSESYSVALQSGFLISNNLTFARFAIFWLWNLGLSIVTYIVGFIKADRSQKAFFFSTFSLFAAIQLLQFTSFLQSNHKFLNLWIIFANLFSASAILWIFEKRWYNKIVALIMFLILTLSGVLDFLVIKNDIKAPIQDYRENRLMAWVLHSIDENEIIFTNGEIYDPASLLGKKVFFAGPYYAYGVNLYDRLEKVDEIFEAKNPSQIEELAAMENIKYILLYKDDFAKNSRAVDIGFFKNNFSVIYEDVHGVVFAL